MHCIYSIPFIFNNAKINKKVEKFVLHAVRLCIDLQREIQSMNYKGAISLMHEKYIMDFRRLFINLAKIFFKIF